MNITANTCSWVTIKYISFSICHHTLKILNFFWFLFKLHSMKMSVIHSYLHLLVRSYVHSHSNLIPLILRSSNFFQSCKKGNIASLQSLFSFNDNWFNVDMNKIWKHSGKLYFRYFNQLGFLVSLCVMQLELNLFKIFSLISTASSIWCALNTVDDNKSLFFHYLRIYSQRTLFKFWNNLQHYFSVWVLFQFSKSW